MYEKKKDVFHDVGSRNWKYQITQPIGLLWMTTTRMHNKRRSAWFLVWAMSRNNNIKPLFGLLRGGALHLKCRSTHATNYWTIRPLPISDALGIPESLLLVFRKSWAELDWSMCFFLFWLLQNSGANFGYLIHP